MEAFGVPRKVVAFVMPTGYSFNLTGSTLYLSLAAIFVAQASGIHLSLGGQLMLMLTLMLTSKGVAGVSRAAMVILLATVGSFGLAGGAGLRPARNRSIDGHGPHHASTLIGNCVATVVVAKWEGEYAPAPQEAAVLQPRLGRQELERRQQDWLHFCWSCKLHRRSPLQMFLAEVTGRPFSPRAHEEVVQAATKNRAC